MMVAALRLVRLVLVWSLFWLVPRAFAQADGTLRWAAPFTTGGYIVSSPAVAGDGTVYVGTQDKYLYAINPNGSLKWRFLTGDWVDATPAIGADGTIYVGSWDGKLYALSPSGVKKWEYSVGKGNYIYSSAAIAADGTIYFGAGDGNLYALRPDGTLKWTYPAGDWIDSSPAIGRNGYIYYGSWDGNVYALRDDGTGAREMWRFATNGPVLSSPALAADGRIYIGSNDGFLYALDGTTGAKRWDFNTGAGIESSAAVGPDGTVYVGGGSGDLRALGEDGALKWKFSATDPIASSPAVRSDGTIIVGTTSAAIYALNADGSQKWKVTTGDWVDSSPVVAADGTIYVGSYDKKIYALNGSSAPASAFASWPMFRRETSRLGRWSLATATGQLVNLSTRAQAGAGLNLIPGFTVAGSGAKPFLLRAVGPTLADFGVTVPLPDPQVELHATVEGVDFVLARNDNWGAAPNANQIPAVAAKVGAFALPEGSRDAAVFQGASPRGYTAIVSGVTTAKGIVLVEVYDGDAADVSARLVNLSARGLVGTGDEVLTLGFVIGGTVPARVLLRGVGPTLARFGVPNVLARPVLTLFRGPTAIGTNSGWLAANNSADLRGAAIATGAFAFDPSSADTALLATLEPGSYTLQISGLGGTTGEALGEIYAVP